MYLLRSSTFDVYVSTERYTTHLLPHSHSDTNGDRNQLMVMRRTQAHVFSRLNTVSGIICKY